MTAIDHRSIGTTDVTRSQPISGHKGRDRWICAILNHHDLMTPLELRVAVRLGIFFNCTTGRCDPGEKKLAAELCIPRRSVRRCVAALASKGFIGRDEGAGGSHDQKRNFSLFMPARGTASVSLVQRTASESPVEAEKSAWHGGRKSRRQGTKTGDTGDQNKGERGTTRRPTNEPDEPEEPVKPEGVVFDDPHTSRVDRQSSSSNSTSDRAPDREPLRPSQRAADAALTDEPVPPLSSAPSQKLAAAAQVYDERAAFSDVRIAWPADRMGDESKASYAFYAALAAAGGDAHVVVDAVDELLWESGADPPLLSDALATIGRKLRRAAEAPR